MLWYLPLESVQERYTHDLCNLWMPDAFEQAKMEYTVIEGKTTRTDINVGSVLDAKGRPIYSLTQVAALIERIDEIQSGDIIYLQDFFTAGIEGLFYALAQYDLDVDIFAMQHAGCFDQHDFTFPMKKWMKHYEIMMSQYLAGVFVASGVHKEMLEVAGYTCPIHVVSLPFSVKHAEERVSNARDLTSTRLPDRHRVIYTSRLDPEKNPAFMLDVAEQWIQCNYRNSWMITTSAKSLRASPEILERITNMRLAYPDKFLVAVGLSKDEYYSEMLLAHTQFNSASQDYVSWTLLESTYCLCVPVYPNYRSFPEILSPERLYFSNSVSAAVQALNRASGADPDEDRHLATISDKGRLSIPHIMQERPAHTENIWGQEL